MRTTRREVLAGLGALPVVVGCHNANPKGGPHGPESAPERPPEPADWVPDGQVDLDAFPWSVQAGDALPDGIVLGVRTTEPEIGVVVVGATEDGWEEVASQDGLAPTNGEVQVPIDGLEPDRAHRYAFTTPDGRTSRVGRFRTALADDGYRKLVIGATSCLGDGNPTWPNLEAVGPAELDFLILMGDTVYADGAVTPEEYREFWKTAFAVPSLNDALAATSLVPVWDDHEVANDWTLGDGDRLHTGVTADQVKGARALFQESLPQRTTADGPLYRTLRWGTVVELIALDDRGERAPGQIVSEEQLQWAIDRITQSPCWLKLVLVSVHMTDHSALLGTVSADDRWQGYPDQRSRIVEAAASTPGVMFVTGDMHYGGIQRVSAEGQPGDGLYEIAAGPSGSKILSITAIADVKGGMPAQYESVVEDWTWARFEIDPGLGEVRVQLIGDDGGPLADQVIRFHPA